ncbi:hypothetical protein LXL04_036022 [Taraxacum kok-saghyz]
MRVTLVFTLVETHRLRNPSTQRRKMSSSSSSVGSRSLRERCRCNDRVGHWTGWRPDNPGRRFIGCPNYRDVDKYCNYFAWVDPELPNQ